MDTVYVVWYGGYDNEIAEIFEDYDEAKAFIEGSNNREEGMYFSIPEEFHFNPRGTIWVGE